jgi:hypothetical protein
MKPTMPRSAADLYAWLGLRWVPRLLAMVDRDPVSATYGCFDRQYWHYRTADFPCGMNQEFGLPLALAHALELPGNRWHAEPRLRQLALAAVAFAARAAHGDGSCDDYFPSERALGATCFALYGCAESCRVLGCTELRLIEHLVRRARFVRDYQESGHLSNHQALAALAMHSVSRLAGLDDLVRAGRARAELALSWQDTEGWFKEYEGCDPGYLTMTIDFLAKLRTAAGWDFLDEPLRRAVEFARDFLHPDGSYAGEYGSRNTFNYMPDGFELLGGRLPAAREIADGWLWGVTHEHEATNDDDRVFVHAAFDQIQAAHTAWCAGDRLLPEQPPPMRPGVRYYANAGLLVVDRGDWHLVIALNKGGVFKAWRAGRLVESDTGLVGATAGSTKRLVSHMIHPGSSRDPGVEMNVEQQRAGVTVPFAWSSRKLASPLRQMAFRAVTITLGRVAPNVIRRRLQRMLITGREWAPLLLRREFDWSSPTPSVTDTIVAHGGAPRLETLYRSTDATSIYVATSMASQEGTLMAWEDLSGRLPELRERGVVTVKRELGA